MCCTARCIACCTTKARQIDLCGAWTLMHARTRSITDGEDSRFPIFYRVGQKVTPFSTTSIIIIIFPIGAIVFFSIKKHLNIKFKCYYSQKAHPCIIPRVWSHYALPLG